MSVQGITTSAADRTILDPREHSWHWKSLDSAARALETLREDFLTGGPPTAATHVRHEQLVQNARRALEAAQNEDTPDFLVDPLHKALGEIDLVYVQMKAEPISPDGSYFELGTLAGHAHDTIRNLQDLLDQHAGGRG